MFFWNVLWTSKPWVIYKCSILSSLKLMKCVNIARVFHCQLSMIMRSSGTGTCLFSIQILLTSLPLVLTCAMDSASMSGGDAGSASASTSRQTDCCTERQTIRKVVPMMIIMPASLPSCTCCLPHSGQVHNWLEDVVWVIVLFLSIPGDSSDWPTATAPPFYHIN